MSTSRRPRFRPLPLLLAALAGCTDGGERAGDDDGATAPAEVVLGTPDVRFGSFDDPDDTLVPVAHAVIGPDGSLWATQAQDRTVLVVDGEGRRRFEVGGAGDGPGEFAAISRLGWVADTLWVADNQAQRITLFDREGVLLTTFPFPVVTAPGAAPGDEIELVRTISFRGLLSGGSTLHTMNPTGQALLDQQGPLAGDDPVVVGTRAGGEGRTVGHLSGVRTQVILAQLSGGQIASISVANQPWADASLLALHPRGDGVAVVERLVRPANEPAHYRVTRLDAAGDTVWSTARAYTPLPADRSRQDSLIADRRDLMDSEAEVRARHFLPPTLPPARSAFIGADGRVWVARERPDPEQPGRWDVFDPDGRLDRQVVAPPRVELETADDAVVWGVETGPFEVPYLVRYPLAGG